MDVVGDDVGEGVEDKAAHVHPRVRNGKVGTVDDLVVEEDKVDVHGSGAVNTRTVFTPPPFGRSPPDFMLIPCPRGGTVDPTLLIPWDREGTSDPTLLSPCQGGVPRRGEGVLLSCLCFTPPPFRHLPCSRGGSGEANLLISWDREGSDDPILLSPCQGGVPRRGEGVLLIREIRHNFTSLLLHSLFYPTYHTPKVFKNSPVFKTQHLDAAFLKQFFVPLPIVFSLLSSHSSMHIPIQLHSQM